jgi:hypothetical protein
MPRKLALKCLTASDLTLFRWHFKNSHKGNQKAFNLDNRVLVGDLYPQLGEASDVPNPRYRIDLYLSGPGLAPEHHLVRKILRQRKNWRLNGEMIDNPDDEPGRYNVLVEGDFALFEFSGSMTPSGVKVVLIAKGEQADSAVHAELVSRYPDGSMWLIEEREVLEMLEVARPPAHHPLYDWVESDALEDAAMGGAQGIAQVSARRGGRGISPEDFIRSRQLAEQTGVSGEELLNGHFEKELESGRITEFEWTASINAVSPFDFRITPAAEAPRLIDAKSTTGGFANPIHFSWNEIVTAVAGDAPYDVFRLYLVTEDGAKLRVAKNIGSALRRVYETLKELPVGMTLDSISVRPELLPFAEEEIVVGDERFL